MSLSNILYIVSCFPNPTETFIQREIDAIRRRQLNICVYALRPFSSTSSFDYPVYYRSRTIFGRSLATYIRFVKSRPIKVIYPFIYFLRYINRPIYILKLMRNCLQIYFLAEIVHDRQIQVIHAHFSDMATDLAVLLSNLTDIPFTFSAHANDIFQRPFCLTQKSRKAKVVFICSRFARRYMETRFKTQRTRCVYHGLDFSDPIWDRIYRQRMRDFIRLYCNEEVIQLLAIGRLIEKKGFHVMIEALKHLKKFQFPFQCMIIGDGRNRNDLNRLIRTCGLEREVLLIGMLPFQEVTECYGRSHLLIVPSIEARNGDRDNIPNVILEAQTFGVPVLASALPSIREVVRHQTTGFLMEPNRPEALAQWIPLILSQGNGLKKIVHQARKQVHRSFDVSNNIKTMHSVWESVIA